MKVDFGSTGQFWTRMTLLEPCPKFVQFGWKFFITWSKLNLGFAKQISWFTTNWRRWLNNSFSRNCFVINILSHDPWRVGTLSHDHVTWWSHRVTWSCRGHPSTFWRTRYIINNYKQDYVPIVKYYASKICQSQKMRGRLGKMSKSLEFYGIAVWTYVVGWRGDIEGIDLTENETTTETKKLFWPGIFLNLKKTP